MTFVERASLVFDGYYRGNLLRSVLCVSVGHQHVNFFQKSFREKSFCMLVYIG